MLIGLDLQRKRLDDFEAVAFEADALDRVVGEQAHLLDAELLEDLSADAVVTFVSLVAEVKVRFDGV